MAEFWPIVITAALVTNPALTQFLGLDAALSEGRAVSRAVWLSALTFVVLIVAGSAAWWVHAVAFDSVTFAGLRLFATVAIVTTVALSVEHIANALWPARAWSPDPRIPWLIVNSALLGPVLWATTNMTTFALALGALAGTAVGFCVVACLLAGLTERAAGAAVPAPLRGAGLMLITAGLLSLAFSGFVGLAGR